MGREKLRELDLNLLVILDALLRCESVSQAAEELNMSQSAVSHALKRLREVFGDALFVRAKDGMAPTPRAIEISGYVTEIIRLARVTLLPSHNFDPEKSNRPLMLALGDAGDIAILPKLAAHLREHKATGRILSLPYTAEEAIPLLGEGKLDLYIGTINTTSADILCQKLYEDRLVIIASQNHKLNDRISVEQYASCEHIMLQSRTRAQTGTTIFNQFEKEGIFRKIRIETPHMSSIPLILEKNDDLIATTALSIAKYYKKMGNIKIIEPSFYLPGLTINQYWHRRFNNDPFTLWARRTMRDLFQNREQNFEFQ